MQLIQKLNQHPADDGVSRKILGRGGDMMVVEVSFDKGAIGTSHSHSHEQASYIAKGSFEFVIGEEKQIVKKGDSLYVPSNVEHGCKGLEESVIVDVFTPQRENLK